MTSIEWLDQKIKDMVEHGADFGEDYPALLVHIQKAKTMYEKELDKQILIIDDIDTELALIEDYAKGEVGNAITKLRKKISYDISRKING